MVVSGKVKMMKPEPAIYDYLLNTHSLNPKETIFIDDLEENILAAKLKGIHGIVFKTPLELLETLESLGFSLPESRQFIKLL